MKRDSDHDAGRRERVHGKTGEAAGRPVDPAELGEKIAVLQSQIALLEEGLTRAPGMERAALAKEIDEYRERLEAAQRALGSSGDMAR